MISKNCLNCEKELVDQYCSACGQKADTHRITFKNFLFHDVLHGTFHLEKGILFTAKEALIRPGKAALDYIAGKRKRYYNVFYLILLTLGLLLFVRHFYSELQDSIYGAIASNTEVQDVNDKALDEVYAQKSKLLIFLFVPFAALNSFVLFRRKRLNLSEHSIITGMLLLGILLISLFGNVLFYLDFIVAFSSAFADGISFFIFLLAIFYIGYGLYNAFSDAYSKWGITYRIGLFFTMLLLEMFILFLILIGFITHWTFVGTYNLNPMS